MSVVVILGGAIGAGVVIIGLIRLRNMKSWGHHDATCEIDVRNKIVLITGATAGLGKEVAFQLLKRGALVVVPGRTLERAMEAIADLRKLPGTSNGTLVPMEMDLASLDSVRAFAAAFKAQFDRLDILINNGGVYTAYDKNRVTKDGLEYNFGVNYVSHFLLTDLLLDRCKAAAKNGMQSRILNVSSMYAFRGGKIQLDDLNLRKLSPKEAKSVKPYNNSKLAQVYFSKELSQRLSGAGVNAYCVWPGWVHTNLGREARFKWYQYPLLLPVFAMFLRTVTQGSQTILHCALSTKCEKESGKVYRNCQEITYLPPLEEIGGLLWDKTVEMIAKN